MRRPPPRSACRRCRTGRPPPTTCRPRSARSRPRCGRASPPPADRGGGLRGHRGAGRGAGRRHRGGRRSAARRSGRSSTTPTSRPAPSRRRSSAKLQRRGCAVVRGHFDREQALRWDRRHRRLRRAQPVLRELPRARRRLLRQRRLQARDLPDLLVARPDAGPAERAHGPRPGVPQRPVDARVRGRARGSTPTATRSTPTGSAAGPPGADSARPGHPPRPRHPRPVDDRRPTSRRSGTSSTAPSSSTTRGTPRTAPPARSTPARRCARRSAPSRAGRRCRTWTTTRACCTPCRSPRRWPT